MCHGVRPHTAVRLHVTSEYCTYATMQDGTGVTPSESIAARQVLPSLQQQLRKELIEGGIDPDAAALVCLQSGMLSAFPRLHFQDQTDAIFPCHSCTAHAELGAPWGCMHIMPVLASEVGLVGRALRTSWLLMPCLFFHLFLNPIFFGLVCSTTACKVSEHAQPSRCSSSSMYGLTLLL